MLEVPTVLIVNVCHCVGQNKGADHFWWCERIAAGGSLLMWQIERRAVEKGQSRLGFSDSERVRYDWSGRVREGFLAEEKGNGLHDGIAGCGAGRNGGERKSERKRESR
jgi:hypothetical protein